jgi:hypothetical protein
MGKRRGAYMVLVGITKGMRSIRKPWRRLESNSKIDLKIFWMGLRIEFSVSG